jgi:hypothetical protein
MLPQIVGKCIYTARMCSFLRLGDAPELCERGKIPGVSAHNQDGLQNVRSLAWQAWDVQQHPLPVAKGAKGEELVPSISFPL